MSAVLALYEHYVAGLKPGSDENYTGFCPLHGEVAGKSKASFSVNIGSGLWCCFGGCGGGGLRRFLKELGKSKEYIDKTVERLKPYLTDPSKTKSPVGKPGLFRAKYPLPEKILGLFDQCPEALVDEGFDEHLLWSHDIGYDPQHHAITFPIRDIDGTLAGIVGRNLSPGDGPKYKVYKSEIAALGFRNYNFDNHMFLWRGDRVYPKLIASDEPPITYVTEGYKTCLWMVQNGYEDTVCLMGSKMSVAQRVFLERLGGVIVLCLDNDPAGFTGTMKIGNEISGCRVLVLNYPEEVHQLDSMSREELHGAVEQASPYFQWRRQHAQRKPRTELPF